MLFAFDEEAGTAASLRSGIEPIPGEAQAIDAAVVIDDDNIVAGFNAAAERLWGYSGDEVLGRNVSMLMPAALRDHYDFYVGGSRVVGVDRLIGADRALPIQHKDGTEIQGSVSISRARNELSAVASLRNRVESQQFGDLLPLLGHVVDKTNRAIYATGPDLRIRYVNAAFVRMFGYSVSEATGCTPDELLIGTRASRAAVEQVHRQVGAEGAAEAELLAYHKDGAEIWVSAALNAIQDDEGKLQHVVSVMTDITHSRQLQSLQHHVLEALANEQPLQVVVDDLCRRVEQIAPDAVCSLLQVDANGILHSLGGPSLPGDYIRAIDGMAMGPDIGSCGAASFYGVPVLATDIDNDPRWQPYKQVPLAAGLKACWSTPVTAKDGRVIGTFAFYFRECRSPSRWHQSIVDACVHLGALIIEREETCKEIARLAYFDALTGLPNRAHMRQLMEQAVVTGPAHAQFALMFLDVDRFKDVNDSLGHAVGDELLIVVADRLRQSIRPGDLLSREGGDEFVVMMPGCSAADAARIASRFTETLSVPLQLGGNEVSISVSVGISMFPDNSGEIDSLVKYADVARYQAKQAGRSTYRFFRADIDRVNEERLGFSTALRNAIAQNTLQLHYQPQIRAHDGSLHGVEALARWNDPLLGEVSPAKFIPLAEECGLIEQIAIWSLREACRQMAAWHKAGLDVPCVSVNLSPINFENANLPLIISNILMENGLAPEMLMLEITEGAVMSDRAIAIENMEKIRAWGVGLSMDDFGTGYSSLSRLAQLPVRELKIDRSFMSDIEHKTPARAIATALIRVGQSLKMTVVAEGVETEAQRQVLADLGCDVAQGFLYSPALSAFDFEAWLTARHAERWMMLVAGCRASMEDNGVPEETDTYAIKGVR